MKRNKGEDRNFPLEGKSAGKKKFETPAIKSVSKVQVLAYSCEGGPDPISNTNCPGG